MCLTDTIPDTILPTVFTRRVPPATTSRHTERDARFLKVADRKRFAAILRLVRADRSLRVYGRFGSFGRVLITDQFRVTYPAWTAAPSMNIHRS